MPSVMFTTENPQTVLLKQLADVANTVFAQKSDLLITESAVHLLLTEMFQLLAQASEDQTLADRLQHLREHGPLVDALKERGYRGVQVVDEKMSEGVTTNVRDKWFPKGPDSSPGSKMRGP